MNLKTIFKEAWENAISDIPNDRYTEFMRILINNLPDNIEVGEQHEDYDKDCYDDCKISCEQCEKQERARGYKPKDWEDRFDKMLGKNYIHTQVTKAFIQELLDDKDREIAKYQRREDEHCRQIDEYGFI